MSSFTKGQRVVTTDDTCGIVSEAFGDTAVVQFGKEGPFQEYPNTKLRVAQPDEGLDGVAEFAPPVAAASDAEDEHA